MADGAALSSEQARARLEARQRDTFASNQARAWKNRLAAGVAATSLAFSSAAPAQDDAAFARPAGQSHTFDDYDEGAGQEQGGGFDEEDAFPDAAALLAASLQQSATQNARSQQEAQTGDAAQELFKESKAAISRGVTGAADGMAGALDMGTGGITFIADIAVHLVTLAFWDIQLVKAVFDKEGKSSILPFWKSVPPLDWSPVPLKRVVSPIWLYVGLIAYNLFILLLFVLFLGFGLIILVAFVEATTNPLGAAKSLYDLGVSFPFLKDVFSFIFSNLL